MLQHAAAVLVLQGPRALGFSKYNFPGVSMPCGKVEPGEEPAQAALREGEEETGLRLELHQTAAFVGFDPVGKRIVHTYLAKVVGGTMHESTPEGTPFWTSLQALATGPYWHYNQRALRHFGYRPPLTGKFHSHITIEPTTPAEVARAAALVGGKVTEILYARGGRTVQDCMITSHYVTSARGLEDHHDIIALVRAREQQLNESGVRVLRSKLEYDLLHDRSDRGQVTAALDNLYTEVHIQCEVPEAVRSQVLRVGSTRSWYPSMNPKSSTVFFLNRRFYGKHTLGEIDNMVDAVVREVASFGDVQEVRYETAVLDTNPQHDKWWME